MKLLQALLRGLALPLALLLIWQAIAVQGWINPQALPSPLAVGAKWLEYLAPPQPRDPVAQSWLAWSLSGELLQDAAGSLTRVGLGFAVGLLLALPLGLAMGTSARLRTFTNPLVQILRPIPPIAYIPLAILWFGLGNPPAVFLIALGAFFPILVNTVSGVSQVDSIFLRAARNLGASRGRIFAQVILPAAMPFILSGVRIGIGTAFLVVIVAEMIAVNSGLGYRILEAREYFWTDKIIAGMLSIGMIGLAIDLAMERLNRHLLRWQRVH
jgi:NitT/TauT family transport system permease protein